MTTAARALASMRPMFFGYLWRELSRRKRQAVFIGLGLALGVGLAITVTAAADGVRNSQATVLHALYGVGTDLTVTQPPSQGSGGPIPFGFRQEIKRARNGEIAAGSTVSLNDLVNNQYSALNAGTLAAVARQRDVTAVTGGLTLIDDTVTGTIPSVSLSQGSGSISSDFTTASFSVAGVDLASRGLGPLSSARITGGHMLSTADARASDALVDSGYAAQHKLSAGGKIDVAGPSAGACWPAACSAPARRRGSRPAETAVAAPGPAGGRCAGCRHTRRTGLPALRPQAYGYAPTNGRRKSAHGPMCSRVAPPQNGRAAQAATRSVAAAAAPSRYR